MNLKFTSPIEFFVLRCSSYESVHNVRENMFSAFLYIKQHGTRSEARNSGRTICQMNQTGCLVSHHLHSIMLTVNETRTFLVSFKPHHTIANE